MKQERRNVTLYSRTIAALLVLILLQGVVFMCTMLWSGTLDDLNRETFSRLESQVESRASEIMSSVGIRMQNANNLAALINRRLPGVSGVIALESAMTDLADFMTYNEVSGVFLFASGSTVGGASVFLLDGEAGGPHADRSDITMLAGPKELARLSGIQPDGGWTPNIEDGGLLASVYSAEDEASRGGAGAAGFGRWSGILEMDGILDRYVAYCVPLLGDDGKARGAFGFCLDLGLLGRFVALDSAVKSGSYVLSVDSGGPPPFEDCIMIEKTAEVALPGELGALGFQPLMDMPSGRTGYFFTEGSFSKNFIGSYTEVRFRSLDERWANINSWTLCYYDLSGNVLSTPHGVARVLYIAIISIMILGAVLAFLLALYMGNPIKSLARNVRELDPEKPIRLKRTYVAEVDELEAALEALSDSAMEAAARMSKIVELVDLPIGSFEVNRLTGRVFLTESAFRLLELGQPEEGATYIEQKKWDDAISKLKIKDETLSPHGQIERLCEKNAHGRKKWIRLRMIEEDHRVYGTVLDVTDEIIQKQRMEYERNFDPLTKLLNRKAFHMRASVMIEESPDKIGLMIFGDLDNLKFFNDTFGHDMGDRYIQRAAEAFSVFRDMGAVVARISGDEFAAFMHGFATKDEARECFRTANESFGNVRFFTQDGDSHKIRSSFGLAFYPEDSSSVDELLKYADYAMYEVKHSIKGGVREFDVLSYEENSYLVRKNDLLNILIDDVRVKYAYQPIVNAKTGDIFAYEALMRPQMRELKSPKEVLYLARAQAKLYQIERLTYLTVLSWMGDNLEQLNGKKVFINSIPNQHFLATDQSEIEERFSHLFPHIVTEVTENEYSSKDSIAKKIEFVRGWGGDVAIDDFGAGYSNELVLLSTNPDYIKIDMSIVSGIDKDPDRQQLIQNTITYASARDIMIIAEGVETREEMETVITLGVDYLQGYYIARPKFELAEISPAKKEEIEQINGRLAAQ